MILHMIIIFLNFSVILSSQETLFWFVYLMRSYLVLCLVTVSF